jgi:hypothetical protein
MFSKIGNYYSYSQNPNDIKVEVISNIIFSKKNHIIEISYWFLSFEDETSILKINREIQTCTNILRVK